MERECVIIFIEVSNVNEKGEITSIKVWDRVSKRIPANVRDAIKVDPPLPHDPENEAVEIIKRLNEEGRLGGFKWKQGDRVWLLCEKE
jgi:hypothetical protein